MSAHRKLSLALYRSVLRWSRAYGEIPVVLNPADIKVILPAAVGRGDQGSFGFENCSVKELAYRAFRASKDFEGHAQELALDRGLKAMQLLHHDYAGRAMRTKETQAAHADRNNVHYSVGQVFIHRKYGYRGVIFGWDRQCEREQAWNDTVDVDPKQPFYNVLPDEDDCLRLFGGVRLSKYVAQENVQLVKSEVGIRHRAIDSYFSSFNPHLDRYVPNTQVAFEYPNDFVTYVNEEDVSMGGEPHASENAVEGSDTIAMAEDQNPAEAEAQAAEKG